MKGSIIFKRVGAYLIDLMVISLISMAITKISFLNPKYDQYVKYADQYTEVMQKYYEKEITIEEFNNQVKDYSYKLNKTGYVYVISDIVVTFLYFGLFASITKGQTLGKKMLSLRIISNKEGKELKWYNYFIRAFILNGVILNIFVLIAIPFSRGTYETIYAIGSNVDSILQMTIALMILFYKNGMGLHDIIAGTRVIDLKLPLEEQTVKKEEKIIKPEKEDNKEE